MVHLQDGSYVHRTMFSYSSWEGKTQFCCTAYAAQDLLSWISFLSILLSYNILFPLCRSLCIVTYMLYELATGYSKITTVNNRTRAQLLKLSSNLEKQLTTERTNPLQYKIYPFIGGPKVSSLQHCGPVPTVTQKP